MTPNDVVTRAIDAVCAGDHLTADHAAAVLAEIMEGRAGEVQTGAFLIALRAKGETVPELVGLARTMRSLAAPVTTARADLVDTAGTGGGPSTFNVSTTAALVAAAAGCAVAKHGNRSEHQQVRLRRPARGARRQHRARPRAGRRAASTRSASASCSRPRHHAAMAHVVPVRKELGGADDLQLPRPADQPGRARAPAARRLRPPLPGDDRRGAGRPRQRRGRWSSPPRTASTSSRSPRGRG